MSRDIRSFFAKANGGGGTKISKETEVPKRRARVLSSEGEDEVTEIKITPKEKVKKEKPRGSKKRRVIESDEEDIVKSPGKNKKPNLLKLKDEFTPKYNKPTAEEIESKFGHIPKRVEKRKAPPTNATKITDNGNPSKKIPIISLDDDDFNESLMQIDESLIICESESNKGRENKSKSVSLNIKNKTPIKDEVKTQKNKSLYGEQNSDKKKMQTDQKLEDKKCTPIKKDESIPSHSSKNKSPCHSQKNIEETNERNSVKKSLADISFEDELKKTPKVKTAKKPDLDSSVLSDEDRHERKRMAAILYQKYKNRSSVINPGSKEIPKGKPNCLSGLTFIVTGILESMERDEAAQVIKDFGGKISSTVGKRLNYMVVGEEAGPKKIATAQDLGIKMISEDELFNLIREKSDEGKKNENNSDSNGMKVKSEIKEEQKKNEISKLKVERDKSQENNTKHREKSSEKRKVKPNDENEVKVKKGKTENPKESKKNDKEEKKKENLKGNVTSPKKEDNDNMLAWVDKYKPSNIKQIIGQQGAASNCVKLQNWLSKWYINHDGKKKLQKPNPWAKNDDGSFYKAALLSGPPGVGKTTTAHLVCKELGFDSVEFNASDTRSKRLLKEEVSELLSNKSLYGYFNGKADTVTKKHVLIMDEVDGMAGNEDRGGVAELIFLIKDSSVPIICMCNDRNHQKMRSLVNYCYDLRFNKPRLEQIRGPIMSICFKENISLPQGKIEEIISATNNDIRQTLNHLSLLAAGEESKIEIKDKDKTAKKDLKLGPWDVVRKVFTVEDQNNMSIHEKSDLFFNDYSLGPLFVQQNYLQVLPVGPRDQIPQKVALAADALSLGDLVDRRIRSSSAWTLLPTQAIFSSVMPGEYMSGHFVGQINFPGWLGKFSKSNKRKRLAQELHDHTRIRTSGSRLSIRQEYAPFLLDAILRPLKEKGSDGVETALEVMKEYRLLREDVDSLVELTMWSGRKNPMDSVDGKVKAALTRTYNKEVLAYSYSAMAGIKKKKAEKIDDIAEIDGDNGEEIQMVSDNEDDDKLENDALIKTKKKPAPKASTSKETKTDSKKGASKAKGKTKN